MFPLSHLLVRFIKTGTLRVYDSDGERHDFGNGSAPVVTFRLHDKALYRKLFLNPELALGEAYMDGTLTFEDCTVGDFLALFLRNQSSLRTYPIVKVLRRAWRLMRAFQQYNPAARARRNVAHHYDLGNALYRGFLDEDMQYSCAYFRHPDDSLEQAQINKTRHIAAKLRLADGQRILDIGCGWGGLALALAGLAEVEVTGITLSEEQHAVAEARARALGLADRVHFVLKDYREMDGRFDRIVSVGMFEHVGARHYPEFFAAIDRLLTEDGNLLLHSIGRSSPPSATPPWIRKYIFPGGYIPALSEVFAATEARRLWVTDVEVLRLHYAKTLAHWHQRFMARWDEMAALYDERFCRMWEFYLTLAELEMRKGYSMVFQMQIARHIDTVPIVRDYMVDAERALRDSAGDAA